MSGPGGGVAMVLAAGRGERMRPLSDVLPKPALPLASRPLVASALALAAAAGSRRAVVNTWHLADRMEVALRELHSDQLEVVVSPEEQLMGGAGGIALARDRGLLLARGSALVLNGDCVLDLGLDPLFDHHASGGWDVTLALKAHPDPTAWARVVVDDRGAVTRFLPAAARTGGEPDFLYTGVMLVSWAALEALPSGPGGVLQSLWRPALERGGLGGVVVPGEWREVGTPQGYLEAVLDELGGGVWRAPSARVERGGVVAAALIGNHARVESGAEVTRSVVAEGAVVRRGSRVIDSVLLGAVETAVDENVVGEVRAVRPHHQL